MNTQATLPLARLLALAALSAVGHAQQPGILFTTSQNEQTLSGSGGTVLKDLRPNEVAYLSFTPCPVISAEKWAPNTCYQTMAGNEDGGPDYYNPTLFGSIDALCEVLSPIAGGSQRTVFISPSVAMGTSNSGAPGLRPGDLGRIIRVGTTEGQVEHFLRAEDLQIALGLPPTPIVVDVDAAAVDLSSGIYLSLDQTHLINTPCGPTLLQDGDVLVIPASAITWNSNLCVQSVLPASAHVLYTEAQMDAFVTSAGIHDRFGNCVSQVLDVEALEIDFSGPFSMTIPCPGAILMAPALIFTAETLTGGGVCTTAAGGQIYAAGCGRLGMSCGTPLPTLGDQVGLLPPSGTLGVPSYLNALTGSWQQLFVIEPKQHMFPRNNPAVVDLNVPPSIVFAVLAVQWAPPTIAQSFTWSWNYFPDAYVLPWAWVSTPIWTPGFHTITSPNIPVAIQLVWQALALDTNGQIILSTPAMMDVL
ncbi:MAG: hypothetical protein JNM84_20660 [Planctomycetes bacterium]|nr:hypothetical protein [Planctomycetota bacterium]